MYTLMMYHPQTLQWQVRPRVSWLVVIENITSIIRTVSNTFCGHQIGEKLGQEGFGTVYLSKLNGTSVAVKKMDISGIQKDIEVAI